MKASKQLAAWLTPATISSAENAFLDAAYKSAPADTDDKTPVADEEGLVHLYTALKTVTGQGLPKCVFARLAIPPPQLPTTGAAQWYMNDELLDCWAELLNRRFGHRCAILRVAAWHKLVGDDEAAKYASSSEGLDQRHGSFQGPPTGWYPSGEATALCTGATPTECSSGT